EELMILANERVAELLASRNRAALYRVHERPDPQAVGLLLAKLADLGVPTPPAPEVLSPQTAAALTGEISRRISEYSEQSGRGWEEPFEGEVAGLIGSGLFAGFGDVFEGFLPARRLPGEFFELNATGTALVGRRSGRSYRLGDPIEVRVESIARHEGKVELAP